jgi:hypothetical protein
MRKSMLIGMDVPAWLASVQRGAITGLVFMGNKIAMSQEELGTPWLNCILGSAQSCAACLHRTLIRQRHLTVRIGRVALIGYSSAAIILTLAVVAGLAWRHPTAVADRKQSGAIIRPSVNILEVDRALASRTSDHVPVHR